MKVDFSAAWKDAMTMLSGQRELLIALAGAFLLLPALAVEVFAPFETTGETFAALMNDVSHYFEENFLVLLLTSIVAAYGQATILTLLVDPRRPTVGEAMGAGLAILPFFFLLNLLVSLIWAVGLMALLIPGFYLIGRTFLANTAMVIEKRRNPLAVVGRAFAVSRGNGWAIFFIVAVVWVVGWVLGIAAASIVGIVFALAGGGSVAAFATAFISSLFGAALQLVLLLLAIALYRQLAVEPSVPAAN